MYIYIYFINVLLIIQLINNNFNKLSIVYFIYGIVLFFLIIVIMCDNNFSIFRVVTDLVLIMKWRFKEILIVLRELIKIKCLVCRAGQVNVNDF